MSNGIAYAIIRRAAFDNTFLQALANNPDDVIKKEGITDSKEISELKQLLFTLLGGMQRNVGLHVFIANQLKSTSEIADAFKAGLKKTVEQIETGFRSTMVMYMGVCEYIRPLHSPWFSFDDGDVYGSFLYGYRLDCFFNSFCRRSG